MCSGYGIVFDGKDSYSFGNDLVLNVLPFGVYNCLSSHTDNRKNNFLVLGEGDTFVISVRCGVLVKKFSINSSKAKTKIW